MGKGSMLVESTKRSCSENYRTSSTTEMILLMTCVYVWAHARAPVSLKIIRSKDLDFISYNFFLFHQFKMSR